MGWNVGLNAGGLWTALLGMALTMRGIMLPSSVLVYLTRLALGPPQPRPAGGARLQAGHGAGGGRAADLATGWLMSRAHGDPAKDWPLWLLTGGSRCGCGCRCRCRCSCRSSPR
jgi:chromate transporter